MDEKWKFLGGAARSLFGVAMWTERTGVSKGEVKLARGRENRILNSRLKTEFSKRTQDSVS